MFDSQHPYGGSQVFVTQFQWVQLPHTNMHAVQTPVHSKLKTNKTLDSDKFIKIVMLPCTFLWCVLPATILFLCWLKKGLTSSPLARGSFICRFLAWRALVHTTAHWRTADLCSPWLVAKGTATVLVVRFPVCTLGFFLSPKIIVDMASQHDVITSGV